MKIVYSCKNGGDYTQQRVKDDIRFWMSHRQSFKEMTEEKKQQTVEIVYPLLLDRLNWECPLTLLEQFEEEEVEAILDQLSS